MTVTEPEQLAALDGKLIWSPDYVETRLKWKQRDPLWVLVLRAAPLRRADHGRVGRRRTAAARRGSTSPASRADPAELPSTPALSDVAFAARKKGVDEALGTA